MLRTSGRRIDMSRRFVDATMPDGSRVHVIIPDMIVVVLSTCAALPQQVRDLRI
jgi:Flp pilus assembly CpaF family ATPase